jgi:flagellar biosynthesis protein FlhG
MKQAGQTLTIAVASGKGGVGKSNIALNLAILLSAGGGRVALVDADLGLANLDLLLDLKVAFNLSHVIAGKKSLQEIVLDLDCGVQFVPGANGFAQITQLSEFHRALLVDELSSLESDNDVIVVDCGAGVGPDVLHFATAADHALVITTPEPTAITDGYAVIKLLTRRGYEGNMSLLVNFVSSRQEGRATYNRVSAAARQFLGVRLFDGGYMLTDPKVREAVRWRQPFVLAYPKCPASRCLAAVANKLGITKSLLKSEIGFFRRLARWFA